MNGEYITRISPHAQAKEAPGQTEPSWNPRLQTGARRKTSPLRQLADERTGPTAAIPMPEVKFRETVPLAFKRKYHQAQILTARKYISEVAGSQLGLRGS